MPLHLGEAHLLIEVPITIAPATPVACHNISNDDGVDIVDSGLLADEFHLLSQLALVSGGS
jgi:hypothetical protein